MDWKTFIINLIDITIWPILIIYIIHKFKNNIINLIYRIKKVSHKNIEIELFEKEIKELDKETTHIKVLENDDKFNSLLKLAKISPRSTIIESFIIVESSINKAITKLNLTLEKYKLNSYSYKIDILKEHKIINNKQLQQLQKLRHMRNQASHMQDLDFENLDLISYIKIAITLSNIINNFDSDN